MVGPRGKAGLVAIALLLPDCAPHRTTAPGVSASVAPAPAMAPVPAVYGRTRTLDGAPCADGGPMATATVSWLRPGKPPDADVQVDVVIRNPLPHAVWFVWQPVPDPDREYDAQVTEVELSRVSEGGPGYVWEFLPGVVEALRLESGAQTTVRSLRVTINRSRQTRLTFALAEEILVGGVPAARWMSNDGYAPRSEISGPGEGGFAERHRADPRVGGADLDIRELCAVSVDLPPR